MICMLLTGSGNLTLLRPSQGNYSETWIHLHSRVFEIPEDWTEFCVGLQYDMDVDIIYGFVDDMCFECPSISFLMFGVRKNCTFSIFTGGRTCRSCTLECTVESDGTGSPFKVRYIQF